MAYGNTVLQARLHFSAARRKEIVQKILYLFRPERNRLLSLTDVKDSVAIGGEAYRGVQTVPIARIIGSEGRSRDFNAAFMPRSGRTRDRWVSVDSAHERFAELPPVMLLKLGDSYFVRDGNHRVSVAKGRRAYAIDAEVIELRPSVEPVTPRLTLGGRRIVLQRDAV